MDGRTAISVKSRLLELRVVTGLMVTFALMTGSVSLADEGERRKESHSFSIEVESTESERESAVWLGYLLARANYISEHETRYDLSPGVISPLFEEEVEARETVAQIYRELKEGDSELDIPYFNDLVVVDDAGFMREYVWTYLNQETWQKEPADLRLEQFNQWCLSHIPGHMAQTQGRLSVELPK